MSMIVFGEYFTISAVFSSTIFLLTARRSSRLMPGFRGAPEVNTTTSESAVSP